MRPMWWTRLALLAPFLAAGCATLPAGVPASAQTAECRAFFATLDRRVDAAGVRDAGAHRIDGFPYLRDDRVLASFAGDTADDVRFTAWVEALRKADLAARRAELLNLDEAAAPALGDQVDDCGALLARLELGREPARAALRARAPVPDDYSTVQRVLGLYPLAVPLLDVGLRGYHREVHEDYARPVESLEHPGALALWSAQRSLPEFRVTKKAPRPDALGLPQLDAARWQALLLRHAPSWWIEQAGDYDRIGAIALDAHGRATVDLADPAVYYLTGYTRFGARVLPTLTYLAWFSERPHQKALDPYAGKLDGVVWRVVLDERGEALAYDTIHSCGCYRYQFAVAPLVPRATGDAFDEPVLLPQPDVPAGSVALRIQSATHYVRRVVAERAASGIAQTYRLRPYESLLSLPQPGGGRRSLFAQNGRVPGTARLERWWLWVSGVPDPGAMRQWGRHPTSFVGERHFDDARFLEQLFEVPAWAK